MPGSSSCVRLCLGCVLLQHLLDKLGAHDPTLVEDQCYGIGDPTAWASSGATEKQIRVEAGNKLERGRNGTWSSLCEKEGVWGHFV